MLDAKRFVLAFSPGGNDQDRLTDKAPVEEQQVKFPGFDGNNEAELLGFASALHTAGNYAYVMGPACLNSHCPMVQMHGRMIAQHKQIGSPNRVSAAGINTNLAAKIHPSNR